MLRGHGRLVVAGGALQVGDRLGGAVARAAAERRVLRAGHGEEVAVVVRREGSGRPVLVAADAGGVSRRSPRRRCGWSRTSAFLWQPRQSTPFWAALNDGAAGSWHWLQSKFACEPVTTKKSECEEGVPATLPPPSSLLPHAVAMTSAAHAHARASVPRWKAAPAMLPVERRSFMATSSSRGARRSRRREAMALVALAIGACEPRDGGVAVAGVASRARGSSRVAGPVTPRAVSDV